MCIPGKKQNSILPKGSTSCRSTRQVLKKLQDIIKTELQRLEKENLIFRERNPTDWIQNEVTELLKHSIVIIDNLDRIESKMNLI